MTIESLHAKLVRMFSQDAGHPPLQRKEPQA